MQSSERAAAFAGILLATSLASATARPQPPQAEGFAVERLYTSAPGAGWLVMDTLDMRGGLGGTAALTIGYSRNPLRVEERLAVVSDQSFADFGFAATYSRFRAFVSFAVPLLVTGDSGAIGGYTFAAPSVDPASTPDLLADARIGFAVRLLGDWNDRFRLGASADLFVPSGTRADYVTDDTYRAMVRLAFAGDIGLFTYAGHLGVHVRPLNDAPVPSSPRGSELLFGVAGGARFSACDRCGKSFVVGPELYGATALQSMFGSETTAFEGLVSARLEGNQESGDQLRVKLGVGAGLPARFGAPVWRVVVAIETFDYGK